MNEQIQVREPRQRDPQLSRLLHRQGMSRMIREAKTGKTGDDHIEGVGRIATMTGGIGEQGNELVEAIERVGPAMREQER